MPTLPLLRIIWWSNLGSCTSYHLILHQFVISIFYHIIIQLFRTFMTSLHYHITLSSFHDCITSFISLFHFSLPHVALFYYLSMPLRLRNTASFHHCLFIQSRHSFIASLFYDNHSMISSHHYNIIIMWLFHYFIASSSHAILAFFNASICIGC